MLELEQEIKSSFDLMTASLSVVNREFFWKQVLLPWKMWSNFRPHKELIVQFTKRDVLGRYRGSYLGGLLVASQTAVHVASFTRSCLATSSIKLGQHPGESKVDFALALFSGLILFDFFAECLTRAPTIVLSDQTMS